MFNIIHKLIVALLGKSKNINTMAKNDSVSKSVSETVNDDA